MSKNKIPEIIRKEFDYMTENYKGKIVELGVKHKIRWFMFQFSEPAVVGFPQVYGIDENDKLYEKFGSESLKLTRSFFKAWYQLVNATMPNLCKRYSFGVM